MNLGNASSLYNPSHSSLTLSLAALALASACSEDRATLRDAALDARATSSPEASPADGGELGPDASDAHLEPAVDAQTEAPTDGQTDASRDAGDVCERVPFPRLNNTSWEPRNGTWVPLDVYCSRDACPQGVYCGRSDCSTSLASLMDSLTCYDVSADGGLEGTDAGLGDAGSLGSGWGARREGCGNVQFHSLAGWPRYSNFDLESGALIGAAKSDDIVTSLPGTSCRDAHFVAGTFAICADASVKYCQRKPQQ